MSDWINPVAGSIITQGFRPPSNPGHQGVDLGFADHSPMGAPIVAPRDGVVVYISPNEAAGGNVTNINHEGGYQTRYDHQSEFDVVLGQEVTQGQVIGLVGATGNAVGAHLHYEIHLPVGNPIDPTPFLNAADPSPTPSPSPSPKEDDQMEYLVLQPNAGGAVWLCRGEVRSHVPTNGNLAALKAGGAMNLIDGPSAMGPDDSAAFLEMYRDTALAQKVHDAIINAPFATQKNRERLAAIALTVLS